MQSIEAMEKSIILDNRTCRVCHLEFKSSMSLSKHIKSHGLTGQEYYDKFNKSSNEGVCYCGKPTRYVNGTLGYKEYCSQLCSVNSSVANNKRKTTRINNFGSYSNESITKKSKATCLAKYGTEHYSQTKEFKGKIKNLDYESIHKKVKATNLEKYGAECTFNNPDTISKIKTTNIERYNEDNPFKNKLIQEKIKISHLEKYGVENPQQRPEVKLKSIITSRDKYYNDLVTSLKHKKRLEVLFTKEEYLELNESYMFKCLDCGKIINHVCQGNSLNYNVISCRCKSNVSVGGVKSKR